MSVHFDLRMGNSLCNLEVDKQYTVRLWLFRKSRTYSTVRAGEVQEDKKGSPGELYNESPSGPLLQGINDTKTL